MDFPIHIDTISMGLPIVYFKGSKVKLLIYDVSLSMKVVLILANSAEPRMKCSIMLHSIWVVIVFHR